MLEVGYVGTGNSAASLQPGVTSANGFDLLTVILHEIGHALGINGTEPGDYNIYPQHVGGVNNVLVKEAEDDTILFESHLAGSGAAPWLMDSATIAGQRTLPTATDVLVIAEDQGITDVKLARVGRINNGVWRDSNQWIGGDVPDMTQDVYITNGGAVALDAELRPKTCSSPSVTACGPEHRLSSNGTFTFTNATVSVGAGGTIAANNLIGDPATLTTTAGSLVRFNQLHRKWPSTASFNGSLAIGYNTGSASSVTYDPA